MRIILIGAELEENLALRHIWSALQADGYEVSLIPFNGASELESCARRIADSGAALAAFSMVFTYRAREFAALAALARELGFAGHIIAGGHFATFNAEALLRDCAAFDSVGCGEGEGLMRDLACNLPSLAAVRGLAWRGPEGRIVQNDSAEKPTALDDLPLPERKRPYDRILGLPIVNILASRGCTHHCAFCSIAAWHQRCGGERFRLRDPRAVAAEMAALYHDGVRIFNFHDDNFILQDKARTLRRLEALERELRRLGVGRIAFAIKVRPDSIDSEVFQYLKEMGLFRVFLGIEGGSARTLRKLGRGQSLRQNEQALGLMRELDLHACFNLLLLGPDSTLEDFLENVAFLRRHPHHPMNFCRTEIYAGTPLERMLRNQGRLLGDYWGYDYRIADPRAQLAFELIYACLRGRHDDIQCLHHMTMDVDFRHQLLAHFKGNHPALRRRVKTFLSGVNRNTCDHLEVIGAAAREGFAGAGAREDFVRAMRERVGADNLRLKAEGGQLLAEVEASVRAEAPQRTSSWRRRAAVAGLVAGVALGCHEKTHPQIFEMAPLPTVNMTSTALAAELRQSLLPLIARRLPQPADTTVTLFLNRAPDGKVRIGDCVLSHGHAVQDVKEAQGVIITTPLEQPGQNRYQVFFTRDEVAAALAVTPGTDRPGRTEEDGKEQPKPGSAARFESAPTSPTQVYEYAAAPSVRPDDGA